MLQPRDRLFKAAGHGVSRRSITQQFLALNALLYFSGANMATGICAVSTRPSSEHSLAFSAL